MNKMSAVSLFPDSNGDFKQYGEQNVISNREHERTSKVQGTGEESEIQKIWVQFEALFLSCLGTGQNNSLLKP